MLKKAREKGIKITDEEMLAMEGIEKNEIMFRAMGIPRFPDYFIEYDKAFPETDPEYARTLETDHWTVISNLNLLRGFQCPVFTCLMGNSMFRETITFRWRFVLDAAHLHFLAVNHL